MRKFISLSLVLIIVFLFTLPALADQLSDMQRKKDSLNRQLNNIKSQKKSIEETQRELESNVNNILSQEQQQNQQYQQLLEEIEFLNEKIKLIDESVQEAELKYQEQKEVLKTRLRVMYENSDNSWLDILVKSKSVLDFFERLELITAISRRDKELVEELKAAKMDVEYKRQLKKDEMRSKQNFAKETEQRLNQLLASRSSMEEEIEKRRQELKNLEKMEDELLKESERLVNEIKRLQNNKKYAGGSMVWPVPGHTRIGSPFGMRFHPIYKVNRMHNGIDIGADHGDAILAANNGTVIISGYSTGGYGNRVVIDHGGGITTLYAHCSKLLVKVGDSVKAGQTIAKIGSTGLSTGPHLHFEVRKNGVPQNPVNYVSP